MANVHSKRQALSVHQRIPPRHAGTYPTMTPRGIPRAIQILRSPTISAVGRAPGERTKADDLGELRDSLQHYATMCAEHDAHQRSGWKSDKRLSPLRCSLLLTESSSLVCPIGDVRESQLQVVPVPRWRSPRYPAAWVALRRQRSPPAHAARNNGRN
jgi:hypothetical protein